MTKTSKHLAHLALACTVGLAACGDSTGSKPGPAAHLDILSGNTQTAPVGTQLPQPLVVKATDANGHVLKGQVVNFVVTAGGGHVFAGTALTDQSGTAQELWTLGPVAGTPQTVEARAVDTSTGQALVFATFTATATAGAPTQAEPLGLDSSVVGVVSSLVEDSFAVLVRDAGGNPVPGVQVAWAVTSGGGTITSPTTTDAQGIARTQWVLGASTSPQTATATVAGKTITFTAFPANQLLIDAGNGQVATTGTAVTVTVGVRGTFSGIPGLPIHWTVTSGGGSVSPAVSKTVSDPNGQVLSRASTQWTLGPAGPQTLTATAGALSVTFTATAVSAGTRTLLTQVPGRVLDVSSDAAVWLDSAGGTRVVKVRTLATGADQVVKVDSGAAGSALRAYAFAGGVLLWDGGNRVFEWRGGTLAFLSTAVPFGGPVPDSPVQVNGPWAAWTSAEAGTGVRRNLPAGTSTPVPTPWSVGPNGEIASPVFSTVSIWDNGTTTSLLAPGSGSITRIYTDGVSAAYRRDNFPNPTTVWLTTPSVQEPLASADPLHGGYVDVRFAGGWAAWDARFTTGAVDSVARRSPAGVRQTLTRGLGGRLAALSPTGTVAYSQTGQYYLAPAAAPLKGVGPAAAGDIVVWRDNRFVLISGGSAYELSP